MKNVTIKGIIPPILTPMHEDESINLAELRHQVNRLIDGGIHGIFPFGTNGEGYILNDAEKEAVLKTVVDETAGRVPVYAGTGCISTRDSIRMSKMAEAEGADILSIITPSFAAASQHELYLHYMAIAEAVPNMPIVLYNIPARTGNKLLPETVARLAADAENIVGAKDSSGDFDNMKAYYVQTRGIPGKDFRILSGNDSLILPMLLEGGAGGIAGCANVYPNVLATIYNAFVQGDLEKAQEAQDSIASFRACFKFGNPNTVVKMAAKLLGNSVGNCRRPFQYLSEEGLEALRNVLAENKEKGMQ